MTFSNNPVADAIRIKENHSQRGRFLDNVRKPIITFPAQERYPKELNSGALNESETLIAEMIAFHTSRRAVCTTAMSTSVPIDYGAARVTSDGWVEYFEEKTVLREYPVSMGMHILEKEALSYCKPKTDLAHDVIPQLMKEGKSVYAYLTEKKVNAPEEFGCSFRRAHPRPGRNAEYL